MKKQAVLLIHGIGEQKPMDTLRSFVDAVLPDTDTADKYWSKPDTLSANFELRRLSSHRRQATDFYEYYWAHHVEGTKVSHLFGWVASLVIRRKIDVPDHLISLWRLSRLLTISIIALLLSGFVAGLNSDPWTPGWLIGSGIIMACQWFLVKYIGDAARYLSPSPENIGLRNKIRKEGIQILRKLHEKKYDRIIVVGHSLGSVIGYDLISLLWHEYCDTHEKPKRMEQPAIIEVSEAGEALNTEDSTTLESYRKAQKHLWFEQIEATNPWRVSDFITLGSPLAHAILLLARNRKDCERRIHQRELPTCPPVLDGKTYCYWRKPPYNIDGLKISLAVLHHAAPFAVTRWTNIYFPALGGLFGDFVGGPLRTALGLGIRDIPVTTSRWRGLAKFTPMSHTMYWEAAKPNQKKKVPAESYPFALSAIKDVLDLEGLKDFVPNHLKSEEDDQKMV